MLNIKKIDEEVNSKDANEKVATKTVDNNSEENVSICKDASINEDNNIGKASAASAGAALGTLASGQAISATAIMRKGLLGQEVYDTLNTEDKQLKQKIENSKKTIDDLLSNAGYKKTVSPGNETLFSNDKGHTIQVANPLLSTSKEKRRLAQRGPHAIANKNFLPKFLQEAYAKEGLSFDHTRVVIPPTPKGTYDLGVAAHEIGHAISINKKSPIHKLYLKSFGAMPVQLASLGTSVIAGSSFIGDKNIEDKVDKGAAGIATAMSLPTLAGELEASYRGSKLLKGKGLKARLAPFGGIPSYLGLSLAPAAAYAAKKLVSNDKEKTAAFDFDDSTKKDAAVASNAVLGSIPGYVMGRQVKNIIKDRIKEDIAIHTDTKNTIEKLINLKTKMHINKGYKYPPQDMLNDLNKLDKTNLAINKLQRKGIIANLSTKHLPLIAGGITGAITGYKALSSNEKTATIEEVYDDVTNSPWLTSTGVGAGVGGAIIGHALGNIGQKKS